MQSKTSGEGHSESASGVAPEVGRHHVSIRSLKGKRSVDIGPKEIVLKKGTEEVRAIDLEDAKIDIAWTPAREAKEGPGEIRAYYFSEIRDGEENGIQVGKLTGFAGDDIRVAWDAVVQIIKEHELLIGEDLLRYFKYRYRLGLRTGLEDYFRFQHSKTLADPKVEKGALLLWSARVWKANATVGQFSKELAITPIAIVLMAMVYVLWWSRLSNPSPLVNPSRFLVALTILIIVSWLALLFRWQRHVIPMHSEAPGLYANGLQLMDGDGFVPFSEMQGMRLTGGNFIWFHLIPGRWPDGESDEHAALEDAAHAFPASILGRAGIDALLGRLDRSQVKESLQPMWEEQMAG